MKQENDQFHLERFIQAQSGQLVNASYETALHEIRDIIHRDDDFYHMRHFNRETAYPMGFTLIPPCIISKCRWLPVLSPVLPTYPIT